MRGTAEMTVAAIAATLKECTATNTPVRVVAGDTLAGMGSRSSARQILDVSGLRSLVTHEYHDLTCAVQAGMTLDAMARALGEHGQFVPLDAPLAARATVGGTYAAGWLGPRRHLYGKPRDLAIGSHVVLADGTIAKSGGMVVKNVSGYDMTKLYAGSFGTLAVIAQLNFKTLPLPAARRALLAALPERTRDRAASLIATLPMAPSAVIFAEGFSKALDGEDGMDGRLFVFLEGTQGAIDRSTREIRSNLGRAGVPQTHIVERGIERLFAQVMDAQIANLGERSLTLRSLGLASTAFERAIALRDAAHRHQLYTDILTDAMNGDVFVRVSDLDARAFAEKIEAADDAMREIDPARTIVAGAAPIRESLDPWGTPPAAVDRMRTLKAQFDPLRILNRGRFIAGI